MKLAPKVTILILLFSAAIPSRQAWSGDEASSTPSLRLLVPAYFYPAGKGFDEWKRLIDSSTKAPVVGIVNPDSGPGKRVDENYVRVFDLARGKPIRLIGYVTLSYGKRPISAVKGDIDSWLHFYPDIQGIFFDEQPSQEDLAGFATECFAYAHSKIASATLVTNPGVVCARSYLSARDSPAACLFEHHEGFDRYQLPEWAVGLPSERFVVLLYQVKTVDEMRARLDEAIKKRSGYIYITDAPGPMPWERLPSYWDELVQQVAKTQGPAH
jgi:hypothetical protein